MRTPEIVSTFLMMLAATAVMTACESPPTKAETEQVTEAPAAEPESPEPQVPLYDGLDVHSHEITTDSELAQEYFDQGLVLAFGFNHAEAARSFDECARQDPRAAMCYWGKALVLGPNINSKMPDENYAPASAAMRMAKKFSYRGTVREREYIAALDHRYVPTPVDSRSGLDRGYAMAMRALVQKYPDDLDAMTLYAEALMVEHPWDYWKKNGSPQEWTPEILAVLESTLEADEEHPFANHLYIHAVEASKNPERALAHADRLRDLVPGAGHLVHMPSHIYIRTGRYHEASLANERAIEADERYIAQQHAEGVYPLAYYPHNYHFLWATTALEGRSERAIEAAYAVRSNVDPKLMRDEGLLTLQHYYATPYYALATFGKWDRIMSEEKPADDLLYPRGVWHYARGLAFARQGKDAEADAELRELKRIADDPRVAEVTIWDINSADALLEIATHVLAGEMAAEKKQWEPAIAHLRRGAKLEDALRYDEPPPWTPSVRRYLGAVLLDAEKPTRAEKVYHEDLEEYPENGWALFGLEQALRAQNRDDEADLVEARFAEAWRYADVELVASAF